MSKDELGGLWPYIFTNMKRPNPHWKQAIPTMNFFFSVSINEILIFVFDTHWTLFEGKGAALPSSGVAYSSSIKLQRLAQTGYVT
jgi:hypothetical protein